MANFTLTWDPNNNGSLVSQTVQYKQSAASTWTDFISLGASANLYTINGLADNESFDFRIKGSCSIGGDSYTQVFTQAKLVCPTVQTTSTSNQIGYAFPNLGGSINKYTIELWDSSGHVLLQSSNKIPPFSPTISGIITGLNSSTTYRLRVVIKIEPGFSTNCPFTNISTT